MSVARNFFQKIPFIRITSLFLIGNLFRHDFPYDSYFLDILITGVLSVLIILWFASNFQLIKFQNSLIFIGIILTGYYYPEKSNSPKPLIPEEKAYFLAEVCQKPKEKAKTFQTILLIQNQSLSKPEKVIAYFNKSRFDSTLNLGDQIVINTRTQEIKNRNNPFEFDYQKQMNKNDICYSVYLNRADYSKTKNCITRTRNIPEKSVKNSFQYLVLPFRRKLKDQLFLH